MIILLTTMTIIMDITIIWMDLVWDLAWGWDWAGDLAQVGVGGGDLAGVGGLVGDLVMLVLHLLIALVFTAIGEAVVSIITMRSGHIGDLKAIIH